MESMSKQTNNVLNYNSFESLYKPVLLCSAWGTILSILISRNKNVNMTINELKYETFLTLDWLFIQIEFNLF